MITKILSLLAGVFFLLGSAPGVQAQQYLNQPSLQNRPAGKKATFWDIQKAFNEYWKDKKPSAIEGENAEDGGWQQFKRWEWFAKQRTFPSGNFPNPEILFQEYTKQKQLSASKKGFSPNGASWSFIGPHVVPTQQGTAIGGAGRINCMAFDPTNANTIWVGAACGGLWKSTNGGASWSPNSDMLPSMSISEIVIDPTNTQVMYIATGDKYGIYSQYETWGHYSAGILKSTDGGATWNQTGLNYSFPNGAIVQRLVMDSLNTNILFAATFAGILKTTDGGVNWTNVRAGRFYDIEFHPTNHSILYAGDSLRIQLTLDGGTNWSMTTVSCSGRNSIAVSRANPNVVYAWNSSGFYYSNNSGTSFSARANPSTYCTPYGYYDRVLEVSPVDANIIFAGGMEVARSTNGGTGWTKVSSWNSYPAATYVHADSKCFLFAPGSSSTFYSCNDGGIFKTSDQGATWSDLSGGLDIKQYYRMSSSWLTPTLIYGGAQDNGTDKVTGLNSATAVYGADGEDCLVDFTNDNIVFVSTQSGYFYRSTNGGASFTSMGAQGCDWTSPIVMDPSNHNTMYMGGTGIFKSTNNGANWNSLSGSFDGTCMYSLEVAPSSSNHVYAATFGNIYRTINGGTNWSNIKGNLPVSSGAITHIAVSSANPDHVWVSLSGFNAANKVFYSSTGGTTWTNVSTGLPNVPVNCIEYQKGSNDILYVGTDLGVYYKDATMGTWTSYSIGLPNVIVNELEVYSPTSKLRAATFGRGFWEIDLVSPILQNVDASASSVVSPAQSICDSILTPVVRIMNAGISTLTTVKLNYKIDNQAVQQYTWNGSLASLASANITLPTYSLTSGTHSLVAYTSNPNLVTDQNLLNDTAISVFLIVPNPTLVQPPLQEGFSLAPFPPVKWILENSDNIWSRSTTVGGFGLSTESAKADFYNTSNGTDEIVSPVIDFPNLAPPIRLYFDVAYCQFGPSYIDSLNVDIYDDCTGASTLVYKKGGITLATATSSTAVFVPNAGQWRTDTINLDSYAGGAKARFRFIAKSDNGNDLYLDNINLSSTVVDVTSLEQGDVQLNIYPNPTNSKITVQGSGFKVRKAEVYNLVGEKLLVADSFSPGLTLDLAPLKDGIYFVKVWASTPSGQGDYVVKTEKIILAR